MCKIVDCGHAVHANSTHNTDPDPPNRVRVRARIALKLVFNACIMLSILSTFSAILPSYRIQTPNGRSTRLSLWLPNVYALAFGPTATRYFLAASKTDPNRNGWRARATNNNNTQLIISSQTQQSCHRWAISIKLPHTKILMSFVKRRQHVMWEVSCFISMFRNLISGMNAINRLYALILKGSGHIHK